MSSAGQQMFNLRWNNFQSSISSALHEQLLGEELVDVTLSAEGRTVGAHRVVLSACSPYFKQLFKTLPSQQHPVIVLRDCKFADIQTLLAFIYQGEVQVSNSALPSLLRTAEVLSIKGLTPSHLREEQPSPSEPMVGWGEPYSSPSQPQQPQQQPQPQQQARSRPQPTDESPPKRVKTGGSGGGGETRRDPPPAAAAPPAELPAASPLNLSCGPAASSAPPPPPCQQPLPLSSGRFTLKIPTVPGAALAAADDNGTDGSPHRESDEGSWLDWDSKESRSKPASPPSSASTNVSPPDTSAAEGGPVWKSLLPKPNRRMLPVKCPECGKLISNAYNLRVHMDLHKHLTYICSMCSTPTRSRDTLRKHITNIHKVKGEALREMLDHGIVSSEAPSDSGKPPSSAAAASVEDGKDDKEPVLVVDESGSQQSPAGAETPLSAAAAAAVTTC